MQTLDELKLSKLNEINNEYNDSDNVSTSITGGIIYNNGEASINETKFENNTIFATANVGSVSNLGGVIYNDIDSSLKISNASFINNITASNMGETLGGAIYNKGTIEISNTTFSANTVPSVGNSFKI